MAKQLNGPVRPLAYIDYSGPLNHRMLDGGLLYPFALSQNYEDI